MGVMGDTATAIRDPIFFRWHKFIDDIFTMHTAKLPHYTNEDLQFAKITLDKIMVQTDGCHEENKLTTFMEDVNMDISKNMFLTQKKKYPNSKVIVTVSQVNHHNFTYTFGVTNNRSKKVKAAFRVFMAPQFDEEGHRFELNDQLNLFIEMDKFVQELSTGSSQISRSSTLSSVVKPPVLTFEDIKKYLKEKSDATEDSGTCRRDRYCECGWPPNALVPRGTAGGMAFDLFVMITNWSSDNCTDDLNQGTSYCGVRNGKYPDGRPMGFPFDRPIDGKYLKPTPFIDTFVKNFKNMKSVPVSVVYDVSNKTAKNLEPKV